MDLYYHKSIRIHHNIRSYITFVKMYELSGNFIS